MAGPNGGAQRYIGGIASADTGDEPVSFRKVEAGVEADGHHGGRGFGRADAGQDAEDSVFVEADRMIAGGERNDLIEVLALNPKLVFARRVASVRTAFEHGDDYYFDGDRLTGRCALTKKLEGKNHDYDQDKNKSLKSGHKIPSLDPVDRPAMLWRARMRLYITAGNRENPNVA